MSSLKWTPSSHWNFFLFVKAWRIHFLRRHSMASIDHPVPRANIRIPNAEALRILFRSTRWSRLALYTVEAWKFLNTMEISTGIISIGLVKRLMTSWYRYVKALWRGHYLFTATERIVSRNWSVGDNYHRRSNTASAERFSSPAKAILPTRSLGNPLLPREDTALWKSGWLCETHTAVSLG